MSVAVLHYRAELKSRNPNPPQPLPLGRLQEWIEKGRIDPSQTITMQELHRTNCVKSIGPGGVKLLLDVSSIRYLRTRLIIPQPIGKTSAHKPLPPLQILVSKASQSAIKAVESAGGRIVCRYYNALGVRAVTRPEALSVI